MRDVESMVLNTARIGLEPIRALTRRWRTQTGQTPVAILFYHRVADSHPNGWTVSNRGFQQQLEWLVRNFDVVSLDECQKRIHSGYNQRPTVSITFDDGYAENCELAYPWLLERNIPFTIYVTLQNVLSGVPFQHDLERNCPLPILTAEETRSLAQFGVEIGAHTRTHPNLQKITERGLLFDEVVVAAQELGYVTGRPVRHFAFPFGTPEAVSSETVEMARRAGFASIATANNSVNLPGDNPFHLGRIHGDPRLARIKNWLAGFSGMVRRRKEMDRLLGIRDPLVATAAPEKNEAPVDPTVTVPLPEQCPSHVR